MKKELNIPPLREPYELKESDQRILERYKEELEYRLKTNITFDIYTENFLIHPTPYSNHIVVEVKAGNWKKINTISQAELDVGQGEVFYYFMRRFVDDLMSDLLTRGANTY
jgi:hypothetical protein